MTDHRHQHLVGGQAAAATFYPLPLVRAILQAIRATADAERVRNDGEVDRLEYVHAMPRVVISFQAHTSPEPMAVR